MKEEKKINFSVESVQDLNSSNIWSMTAEQIGKMWEKGRLEEDFSIVEDKLLYLYVSS